MRWLRHNAIRVVLLAHYVLVLAASAWLHDHGHAGPEGHIAQANGDRADCRGHQPPTAPTDSSVPCPRDKAPSCPVCEFLIQKPIPVQSDATLQSAVLVQELPRSEPVRTAKTLLSAWQIRGPPAVA